MQQTAKDYTVYLEFHTMTNLFVVTIGPSDVNSTRILFDKNLCKTSPQIPTQHRL